MRYDRVTAKAGDGDPRRSERLSCGDRYPVKPDATWPRTVPIDGWNVARLNVCGNSDVVSASSGRNIYGPESGVDCKMRLRHRFGGGLARLRQVG